MRFEKLIIENFGPYKDRECIDFGKGNGVNLVWGDNGRGKTSIMNALNFVLFNTVKDRKKNENNFISFINKEGAADGNYTFSVTLHVTDGGDTYTITRTLTPVQGVKTPKSNEDLHTSLTVNKNGDIVSREDAIHIVNTLMPLDVSRFFLFDGELLQEYEELLNDRSPNGLTIKYAIEQILGLPILTYGAKDAQKIEELYVTEASRIAQNDENAKKYAESFSQYKTKQQYHVQEKERLENLREAEIEKKRLLEKEMQETERLRDYITQKQNLETRISTMEQRLEEETSCVRDLMSSAWKWMIVTPVQREMETLNNVINDLSNRQTEVRAKRELLQLVQRTVNDMVCPVCDHDISESERNKLVAKINEMQSGVPTLTTEERETLQQARSRNEVLQGFNRVTSARDEVIRRCATINDLKVEISDLREIQLKKIKTDIDDIQSGRPEDEDPMRILKEYNDCELRINTYNSGIEEEQKAIDELQSTISKTYKKMSEASGNHDVEIADRRRQFVGDVAAIFTEAIDVYRDILRENVERDATELFMTMNEEEDYSGLQINQNYGLNIINRNTGEAIPNRSAGWEHMVAFSLIGALHKNAPFEGPVIMDFPFSRMSTKNKRNMMRAVPMMSDQVMLLIFPGEIDKQATRADIGQYILQEWTLERVSALHSHIERGDLLE